MSIDRENIVITYNEVEQLAYMIVRIYLSAGGGARTEDQWGREAHTR